MAVGDVDGLGPGIITGVRALRLVAGSGSYSATLFAYGSGFAGGVFPGGFLP